MKRPSVQRKRNKFVLKNRFRISLIRGGKFRYVRINDEKAVVTFLRLQGIKEAGLVEPKFNAYLGVTWQRTFYISSTDYCIVRDRKNNGTPDFLSSIICPKIDSKYALKITPKNW